MQFQKMPAVIFMAVIFAVQSLAQDGMMLSPSGSSLYSRTDVASNSRVSSPRRSMSNPSSFASATAGKTGQKGTADKAGISSGDRPPSPRTNAHAQAEQEASKARSNYWDIRKEFLQKDQAHQGRFFEAGKKSPQAHQSQVELLQHQDRVISAKDAHTTALAKAKEAAMTAQNTDRAARNHIKAQTARKTADKLRADQNYDAASLRVGKAHNSVDLHHMWKGPDHPNTRAAVELGRIANARQLSARVKQRNRENIRYAARRLQGKDSDSSDDEAIFSNLQY